MAHGNTHLSDYNRGKTLMVAVVILTIEFPQLPSCIFCDINASDINFIEEQSLYPFAQMQVTGTG